LSSLCAIYMVGIIQVSPSACYRSFSPSHSPQWCFPRTRHAHGTRSQARALARKHTRQAHARKHANKSTSTPQVLPLTPRGPPDSRSNSNAYSLLSIALAPNYQSSNVSSLSVHPLTISVSVRPRARMHAHAHARAHIHTHTHIYTYTHTHLTVAFPSG
jgi:hypothetical protein